MGESKNIFSVQTGLIMKFDVYSAIKGNSVSMHLQKLKINPWIVFINLTCQENLEKCFRLYSEF